MAVGLATRLRPKMLERCLGSLGGLELPQGATVSLIVVENDTGRHAEGLARRLESGGGLDRFDVIYALEPSIGISCARNRILEIALERGCDYLAFVDDDETVRQGWLVNLLDAMTALDADLAGAPVVAMLPEGSPDWVGLLWPQPDQDLEAEPRAVDRISFGSGNCMLRLATVDRLGERFDRRFNRTGGGDTEFFERLVAGGAHAIHVPKAWIREEITKERTTLGWLFRRQAIVAANRVRGYRAANGRGRTFARYARLFLRRAAAGLPFPLLYVVNRRASIRPLVQLARAAGIVHGLAGRTPAGYDRVFGE